jgi:hypothetical protein
MRQLLVIFAFVFLGSPARSQEKPAELTKLNDYGDSLSAEGVWRADELNEKTENAFDSVTRLECHKHGGKDLVNSDAYCMQATASITYGGVLRKNSVRPAFLVENSGVAHKGHTWHPPLP